MLCEMALPSYVPINKIWGFQFLSFFLWDSSQIPSYAGTCDHLLWRAEPGMDPWPLGAMTWKLYPWGLMETNWGKLSWGNFDKWLIQIHGEGSRARVGLSELLHVGNPERTWSALDLNGSPLWSSLPSPPSEILPLCPLKSPLRIKKFSHFSVSLTFFCLL